MKSSVVKRSILIGGHKTSISLEDPFWTALKQMAHARHMTLSALIAEIDDTRDEQCNLSSAIRLFVLHQRQSTQGPAHGLAGERNQLQRGGFVVTFPTFRPPAS